MAAREGCQNPDPYSEGVWLRCELAADLGGSSLLSVTVRPVVALTCYTRVRIPGTAERRKNRQPVRAVARPGSIGRCCSISPTLPSLLFEAARPESTGRVHQGRGTCAAAAPALGLGAPASISEASARRSCVSRCACSSASAAAPARLRGDTGDAAVLASGAGAPEVDVPAAQAWPPLDRPRVARLGAPTRPREPALGLSANRRRADQAWLLPLTEHRAASACLRWPQTCTATRRGELDDVPSRAGREHARLRLLHCRDGHASPPLRALLHRTRQPARPPRWLHHKPDQRLGCSTGAQPQLHWSVRADAFPDPRPRQQVRRFFRRGGARRGNQGDRTPVRAPQANAYAERFIRTIRTECLDWLLIVGHRRLEHVLRIYIHHYSCERPPRTRAPAASSATAQATASRQDPTPRPSRRSRARVLQGGRMTEPSFDTLQPSRPTTVKRRMKNSRREGSASCPSRPSASTASRRPSATTRATGSA
jgi:Integrase core domain